MTVYFGNVSHKPSRENPVGTRRWVEGATDNPEFASIFNRSGRVNITSSNAKLSVIDLYNSHSIFIDPQEMEQMSEAQFLAQHASMVSNYRALGRYMLNNHRQEMQVTLSKLVPAINISTQGDAVIVSVAKKLIGLAEDSEVLKSVEHQSDEQAFRETIYRELKREQRTFNYNVHGIGVSILLRLTGARIIKANHTVRTTFKIIDSQSDTVGSANNYTRKADRKYKKQLQGFSRLVRNLENYITSGKTGVTLEFSHRYNEQLSAMENAEHLKDMSVGDLQEIQRNLQKLFDAIQPADVGLDPEEQFDDFNPASTIRKLWNELGFASSDISININEFDRELLLQYANSQLSAREIFNAAKDYFTPRIQSTLANRFNAELVDYGALAEIMVDEHSDDWRGVDRDELVSLGEECIELAANQYSDFLKTTTNLEELLRLYHASNKMHEDQIMRIASPMLVQREGAGLADSRFRSTKLIKKQLNALLLPLVETIWNGWLDNHHISLTNGLNTHLDSVCFDVIKNEYLNELLLKANSTNNDDITETVKEFINEKQEAIYNWYEYHYDYAKGLGIIQEQLLAILEHELPYRQVKDGYWKYIIKQLIDFNEATQYILPDGINNFVNKYASNWEDYRIDDSNIHEEAKKAIHNRMNILLEQYLEKKGISTVLFKNVNGDIDALMGTTIDSNLSIVESVYPQFSVKMTITEFINENLKAGNAVVGFFNPGYQKVIEYIKEKFLADKSNSKYPSYTPHVVFPLASAYGQDLITYDEYVEQINPDIKEVLEELVDQQEVSKTETNMSRQMFNDILRKRLVLVLSDVMESTGISLTNYGVLGKGVYDLVDRDMGTNLFDDLYNQTKNNKDDVNSLIEKRITPEWIAKHYNSDLDEAKIFINQRVEEQLADNPKVYNAFSNAGVSLEIPRKNDIDAYNYWTGNLTQEKFIRNVFPSVANQLYDQSSDITRSALINYINEYLTQRFEQVLDISEGMRTLVTQGSKVNWTDIIQDIEENDLDKILDYVKVQNYKDINDLKSDIESMYSVEFIKSRLQPSIDEAVATYTDKICGILMDEIKEIDYNQITDKVREAILRSPKDAVEVTLGHISAFQYVKKYNLNS